MSYEVPYYPTSPFEILDLDFFCWYNFSFVSDRLPESIFSQNIKEPYRFF